MTSARQMAAVKKAVFVRHHPNDVAGIAAHDKRLEDARVVDAVAALKREVKTPQQRSIIASAFGFSEAE